MPNINFPNTPTINQKFSIGTKAWRWDGEAWVTDTLLSKNLLTVKTISATKYTLSYLDADNIMINMTASTPCKIIVPTDAVNIPVGSTIIVGQEGTGTLTITPATGVTVKTPDSLIIAKQHGKATLIKVGANAWEIEGNLKPFKSYAITSNALEYNEGDQAIFTVTGVNIENEILYWKLIPKTGTLTNADLSHPRNGVTYGGVVNVINNYGTFGITFSNDKLLEGAETFTVELRKGEINGIPVAESSVIKINDTSYSTSFGSEFVQYIPSAADGYTLSDLGDPVAPGGTVNSGYIIYTVNGNGSGAIGGGGDGLGLMYDPSGTGNYGVDDYITPGTEWEGFAVEINGTELIAGSNYSSDPSTTTLETTTWKISDEHYVLLKGSPEIGFLVMQYITFTGESIIRICMSYTNTTGSAVNLRFMRGVDPDVDVYAYGSYDTYNQRGWNNIPPTELVYSIGTSSGKALSLYTTGNGYTHNTAVISNWPTYNVTDILTGRADSGTQDDAICCAWDTGVLAAGESRFVTCYYICGNNIEDVVSIIGNG